jgi:hypothetical protein
VASYGVPWLTIIVGRHLGPCPAPLVATYGVPWLAAMVDMHIGPCLATMVASYGVPRLAAMGGRACRPLSGHHGGQLRSPWLPVMVGSI